jgi:hypothetical protein
MPSVPRRDGDRVWAAGHQRQQISSAGMANIEIDGLDAPVCPLLGLAADRRSQFTYPHPGHLCFAPERPATTD